MDFDPNGAAAEGSGLFALPCTVEDAAAVIVPAPWDATSSQDRTSSGAPDAVFEASKYVELFDPVYGPIYEQGIAMAAVDPAIATSNRAAIALQNAQCVDTARLDTTCEQVNESIRTQVAGLIDAGKTVGLLGGDHSVSFGSIEAHLARYPRLGVLQVDAHCDLRSAYDGVRYSHASIMYNALEYLGLQALVQVGVRGLCEFEAGYASRAPQVQTFFDASLRRARADGESWSSLCEKFVSQLPDDVYISFDIDGLEPAVCPHTGTPVPGGLTYNDALSLLYHLATSGKRIVGFDLVEVGAHSLDAAIAAHLLYQLCGASLARGANSLCA